jgi:hypothetical protein
MTLRRPSSPALPLPSAEYDVPTISRFHGVLRLYFSQLDAFFTALIGVRGGQYMNNPYGSFSNRANQTAAAANTDYVVTLSTTDLANGTSLDTNQITVAQSGVYNMQFSIQLENADTQEHDVDVWFRKNGDDLTYTASRYTVAPKHGGVNGHNIAVANFFAELVAGDYVELVWATGSTQVQIEAYADQTAPYARPGVPSSVLTLSFVSALTE